VSTGKLLLRIIIFFIVKDPSHSLNLIMSISYSHGVENTYYKSF